MERCCKGGPHGPPYYGHSADCRSGSVNVEQPTVKKLMKAAARSEFIETAIAVSVFIITIAFLVVAWCSVMFVILKLEGN